MPVHVGSWARHGHWNLRLCRHWLLQPVPHGLRISGLTLIGNHTNAPICPTAAVPQDLCLMQASQLQDIQLLDIRDAQCPDLPPMPSLSYLIMCFEPLAAHAMLPLPRLTQLEVLCIQGVDNCPSLSCLSRLTRLELSSHSLPGGATVPGGASADISQGIKVCHAPLTLLLPTAGIASRRLGHASGLATVESSGPELDLP